MSLVLQQLTGFRMLQLLITVTLLLLFNTSPSFHANSTLRKDR